MNVRYNHGKIGDGTIRTPLETNKGPAIEKHISPFASISGKQIPIAVVSENSNGLDFMPLHGNSSEAARQVACDNTRRLRTETPGIPVG